MPEQRYTYFVHSSSTNVLFFPNCYNRNFFKCPRKAHAQRMQLKHVHHLASRLEEHRYVKADKVAVPKRPVVRDGVAGDLVDAGANRLDCGRQRRSAGTHEKVRKQKNTHTQITQTHNHTITQHTRTYTRLHPRERTHARTHARTRGRPRNYIKTQTTHTRKNKIHKKGVLTYEYNGDRVAKFLFDE